MTYHMVVTYRGASPSKMPIVATIAEMLIKYTIELPKLPSGGCNGGKELLLPKQQYEKVKPRLVEHLGDEKLAGSVITVLEAIESDHSAIIITTI